MTKLVWTDPETGEEQELGLDDLGGQLLADVPLVPHFLRAAMNIATEIPGDPWGGRLDEAPIAVVYTDGVPCVARYAR